MTRNFKSSERAVANRGALNCFLFLQSDAQSLLRLDRRKHEHAQRKPLKLGKKLGASLRALQRISSIWGFLRMD